MALNTQWILTSASHLAVHSRVRPVQQRALRLPAAAGVAAHQRVSTRAVDAREGAGAGRAGGRQGEGLGGRRRGVGDDTHDLWCHVLCRVA